MTKILEIKFMPNRNSRLEKLVSRALKDRSALNVTLVYEDASARQWAHEIFARMEKVAGSGNLRPTWWNLHDLNAPGVLAGAVSTTLRADFIIVATRSGEALPLPFYVWVNAWLPHRSQRRGVLINLLGNDRTFSSDNPGDFLREVARSGRMEFLLHRRRLAVAPVKLNWFETLTRVNVPIAMLN